MSDTLEIKPRQSRFPGSPRTLSASAMLPPDITAYTQLAPTSSAQSYAGFGAIPMPLGGGQPFSYSLLFRIANYGAGLTTGYTYSEQILTFNDGPTQIGGISAYYSAYGIMLNVYYQNGTFQLLQSVELNRWYELTFTWDGTNASAYLDGGAMGTLQLSQAAVGSPTFRIGLAATNPPAKPSQGVTSGPLVGDVKRFYVWKRCLTAQDVAQQMWTAPSSPLYGTDVVLGYDFTTNPPTNVGSGPNLNAVNLAYASGANGLFSWGMDVAVPGQGTKANPGAGSPFSALAWIYLGNPVYSSPQLNGYIWTNGDLSDSAHVAMKLVNGQLAAEVGSTSVQSGVTLQPYTWYYVGITFDGSTASLYVDGTTAGSGPASGSGTPAAGTMRLFGALDGGQPSNLFQGYAQFLSVWNTALTPAQVAAQAYEDPTLDAACIANFMLSAAPCLDSVAVTGYGLWDANEVVYGSSIYLDQVQVSWSPESPTIESPRRPGTSRVSRHEPKLRLRSRPHRHRPPAQAPFGPEHRERMVAELKHALSSVESPESTARWLADYRAEVERVFDLAATSPEQLEGPHVSYRRVGDEWAMFYHPDAQTEVDLEIRADISQECAMWWATFILTAILGLLAIFGISTPLDDLKALAARIVSDPAVIETLQTITGLTMTAGTMLSFCKVLYDFGYLSQAFWLALSSLSWWAAAKFIIYVVGIFAPVASPQKALVIANSVVTVGRLAVQLTHYPSACGAGA